MSTLIRVTFQPLYLFGDVIINISLLYLYIISLHAYSIQHYFDINDNYPINDRQHELMIEATRYAVLFGLSAIYNIIGIFIFCGIASYIYFGITIVTQLDSNIKSQVIYIILGIIIFFKEIMMLQAIHLSFKFSHRKYESKYCCYYCDKWMKRKCHKIAMKANKNEIIKRNLQYQQKLLSNNDVMHQL